MTANTIDQLSLQTTGDLVPSSTTGIIQFGTSSDDIGNGIATDSDGNIYVTGYTHDSLPGNTFTYSLVTGTNVGATLVGVWDLLSYAYAVTVVGNYAYAVGDRLEIIDISNPSQPTFKGNYDIYEGRDVQVVGNTAYVADGDSGLQIINITNPSTPTLLGNYNTNGRAYSVQVVGNTAYVADYSSGLQIIDITNPSTPTRLGNYDPSGYANGVEVVGNTAYVAYGDSGLQIIDITNPSIPTLKGNYNTSGNAEGVQVVGNYAYVADSGGGLNIIDVSGIVPPNQSPTDLTLSNNTIAKNQAIGTVIGNFTTTDPNTGDTFTYSLVTGTGSTDNALFTINGNQLKTNATLNDETRNSYSIRVKTTDQGGLSYEKVLTINVNNVSETPTNLTLSNSSVAENQAIGTVIGNFTTTDPNTGDTFTYSLVTGTGSTDNALFTISGNQLKTNASFDYETQNSYSIRVKTTDQDGLSFEKQLTINITDVGATLVGSYNTSGSAYGVQVVGNTAYVADYSSGLQIIDITNPSTPTLLGNYNTSGRAYSVEVVGNTAYVADGDSGLQIIDITNPSTPTLLGNYNTSGLATGVEVVGNTAYVADGFYGLKIIDITNPANPTLKGNYYTGDAASGLQIVGNTAYVADSFSGLEIIDITNPSTPTRLGHYYTVGAASGVQVVSNIAYVASGYSGLQIIDITNPSTPTLLGNYNTSSYALGVQVVGNTAYVAYGDSGLQIIDITNPSTPTLLGNYNTSGWASDVQVVGNYAYVADGEYGLNIIDVSEFVPPNQSPTDLTLSNNTVAEDQPLNTLVGNFTTTDPDTGNTFTYSLVSGTGDTDNSLFTISGNQLKTSASFDYETQNSYNIRVQTTDQGGLSYEKQLTISVTDVNENPTNLTLSNNIIAENSLLNTLIGNFTTTDPDTGNTFTYSLVTGTGSTDNALFTISGNQLKTNATFDYETRNSYNIRVKTTDQGGLSYEKQLTINITDVGATLVGVWDLLSYARAVTVVGNYAYVVGDKLDIIDISNPSNPTFKGTYDIYDGRDVQVVGNYAYVADGDKGLKIIDITNPSTPTLKGNYDTSGYALDVQIVGNTAYVADNYSGLQIIDITNPSTPTLLGNYDTSGDAEGVEVVGNTAYVADVWTGLQIIDITNPSTPTLLSNYYTSGWASDVQIVGNTAYVTDDYSGLKIIDITNPANPTLLGNYDTSGWASDVEVVGNTAYVADSYSGLQIIDITNPSTPTRLGNYYTSGYAEGVQVVGNTAYVADGFSGRLEIIDITNPSTPTRLGNYDTSGYAEGVEVVGNTAYVADGFSGLEIIDITNPSTPTRLGNYYTSGYARDVQVVGNIAYVADDWFGLQIIDISNPTTPTRLGNYYTFGNAYGVEVVGNTAYVADGYSGLQIIDITNPSTPILLGNYYTSGSAWDVQVVGNTAYVADYESGLQIIDITNPSTPTLLGNYDTSGYAIDVQVVGNTAYVADGGSGLQIIDITNPSTPTLLGNYFTSGDALGVQVVGNYAYVADHVGGLKIIDVSEFVPPNQSPTDLTLSNNTVAENEPVNTLIGNFTSTDPDTGNTFTYSLVSGTGDTDNSLFTISGNQLKTNATFDYETKNSYNIRVKTTDQGGLSYEKPLTVNISDVNENNNPFTFQLILREDNNGTPGNIITDNIIKGSSFFAEIQLGDIRTNALGLISAALNVNFAADVIQNSDNPFDPTAPNSPLITPNFTLFRDGNLDNANGLITNLSGAALPITGDGFAIGVNQLSTFSLLHFQVDGTRDDSQLVINLDPTQTGYSDGSLIDANSITQLQTTLNINDAPSVLAIGITELTEDSPPNTVFAFVIPADDHKTGQAVTFSLSTVPKDNNNNPLFTIDANTGRIALTVAGSSIIDYESGITAYTLGVKIFDGYKYSPETTFTFNITDVNENPTNLTLSNNIIAENSLLNTLISNFTTTDPDTGNTFTYSLVSGTGDTDNSLFSISGNQLKVNGLLDYETKPNYNIRVKTTDQGGLSYEKQFTINVTNVLEQAIAVDKSAITFGTPLSQYRQGWSDSNLVRPTFADTFQYIDITNTGVNADDILFISGIEIKADHVTTNANFSQGDILLNPGENQRFLLTFAPTAAQESFNLNDGLIIHSNAINNPNLNILLTGQSTFNSDVTYNGRVDRGDLAPLQAAFNSSIGDSKYDPTADINGDGKINLGDFLVLNSEYGLSLT